MRPATLAQLRLRNPLSVNVERAGGEVWATIRDALRQALREELLADPRSFSWGDIGAWRLYADQGLPGRVRPERIRDTPTASWSSSAPVRGAMAGRPMVELMTISFSLLAIDQIINNASKLHYMSGGQISVRLWCAWPRGWQPRRPAFALARRLVCARPA
jgi:pyruvate/2-oxoglutarate/acetoin dehydrogenase E1 component